MTSGAITVTSMAQTGASFGPLQQLDAGLLNVGYGEAGLADGPGGGLPSRLARRHPQLTRGDLADRFTAGATITEVGGSHVMMLSQPEAIAHVIMTAAGTVGSLAATEG